MQLDIQQRDQATIVRVEGATRLISPTSTAFREAVAGVVGDVQQRCILDLSDVESLDSTGLSAIIAMRRDLLASGRSLVIAGLTTAVRMLFELTRLHEVFTICDSLDAAMAVTA